MANYVTKTELVDELGKLKTEIKTEIKTEFKEATQEILHAMNVFASDTQNQFNNIHQEITGIKAVMVTKSYLDDKLADLRSDLGGDIRKTNIKVHALTEELETQKTISKSSAKKIKALPPFANAA